MKSLLKKMVVLPFLAIILFGCGTSPVRTITQTDTMQGKSLDTAIQEAARNIEQNIDARVKVVVLNFSSTSTDFSEYVLGELSTELVNGKRLQVVDRKNLDAIRAEMDFQLSGEVSDESAQAIGRKLGAEYIISGSLANTGGIYRFRINTINVESAGIAASSATDIANDSKVQTLLASGAGAAVTQTAQRGTANGSTARQPSAAPDVVSVPAAEFDPNRVYQIGDRGPAGGWIFYDKGGVSNGWRYLEAAPSESEAPADWGSRGKAIGRTSAGIGAGKQNTEIIVNYMSDQGILGTAAQMCVDLFTGGFNDWFLPSKGELDLMYRNLKTKRIGSFGDGSYWSSSEVDSNSSCAWMQRFNDGRQGGGHDGTGFNGSKDQTFLVRAIRQF
ncbi:MAG: hypothetical protein LBQ88_11285 [Treponema sp.]|jgi:TolB-like protein|nr:hypothetical protein [Treponema sp.]